METPCFWTNDIPKAESKIETTRHVGYATNESIYSLVDPKGNCRMYVRQTYQ